MSDDNKAFHQTTAERGITIREWFAGQALAGINANPDSTNWSHTEIARCAVASADALIEALKWDKGDEGGER